MTAVLEEAPADGEDFSEDLDIANEVLLDEDDAEFVRTVVDRVLMFAEELVGYPFFPYQRESAYRIVESLIIGDGEEITLLQARQSGKSQVLSVCIAACMVLFPRLAKVFPKYFAKYERGFWVGVFAPTDEQADTVWSRVVEWLTSERATEIMLDPEIDDAAQGKGKLVKLKKSGSFCRQQTAHPRAKIESKSYHFILVDEAQDVDALMITKSISPMAAFYNGTKVLTGTPNRTKGYFYRAIQLNKRRQTRRGLRQNHFEYDWKHCARSNKNYARYMEKEKVRLGEDSDEFQLSYCCKWLLDRGMFMTEDRFTDLSDTSMERIPSYWNSPVVVGVDPARTVDSTVVTVAWVDWDYPDDLGFYMHRVLNWLEIQGDWEEQYYRIVDFLSAYRVYAVAVDCQGVGDAVAQRLAVLMPDIPVVPIPSTLPEQSKRWKHLQQLIERGMVGWPAHAKTRRLRIWKRFQQQMLDAIKKFKGPHMIVEAPEEEEAHDDYVDSLALACVLTVDATMPEVEISDNPFYGSR